MDTEIDWQRELDDAFGRGPDVTPGAYVAHGRRALRRRRTAVSLAAAAAVVVAAGGAWTATVASHDGRSGSDEHVATRVPSPKVLEPEEATPLDELVAKDRGPVDFLGDPAVYRGDELVLNPRTSRVLERVPNPMGYTATQGRSIALRVVFDGVEKYTLVVGHDDGTSMTTHSATGDFGGWLAGVKQSQHTLDVANGVTSPSSTIPAEEWIALDRAGEVVAADPAVTVLTARTDLDLGPELSTGTELTGLARLRVGDETQVVVLRVVDGTLEVLPIGRWSGSLDVIAGVVREDFAGGEGVR
ncbi:hypothetical protein SAMN04489844_0991 [Nocardioides exalbidus]|uniref:Uncharacterized protein n=1 Tax=Nocardioides exalbidus TaxID=402596 RepID=A0A1H4LXL2_9ACTN|nr:hypothetical protein [Nocardioides exalbidus]SEB75443.1 hypothetical protein SAMN04489844_0991 [Nocardioides exalbidus]